MKIKWTKTYVKYKSKTTSLKTTYLVPRTYEIKLYNRGRKEVNVGEIINCLWFDLHWFVCKSYTGLVCHINSQLIYWDIRFYAQFIVMFSVLRSYVFLSVNRVVKVGVALLMQLFLCSL